jgi:hypothetical protein
MRMKTVKLKYWRATVATIALLMVLLAPPALAATTNWIGDSGNWSVPSNWDNGVPAAGDDAFLTSNTKSKTATLDTVTPLLNSVVVDGTGGFTFTLRQTYYPTGSLSALAETIGSNGKGVYNQSSGSNSVTNDLILGLNAQGIGTYNQTGGNLSVGNFLIVGQAGQGYFNQSNVTNTVGMLVVGYSDVGSGTYTLNNGTLNVNGFESIGAFGTGTFKQSSGSHTIGSNLYVGQSNGSSGTYTKSSGSLSVGGAMFVGYGGTGDFSSSSGNVSITNQLIVGRFDTGSGSFSMGSGTLSVGGSETIGYEGPGTFTHSSGVHTIGGALIVGRNAPGSFTMTSGSLQVAGNETIGAAADGSLTKTSGSHTIGNNFIVGRDPGITGTVVMTSGSLNVGNAATIGRDGIGSLTMTSGSFTIAKKLFLARNAGSSGEFTITSGSVNSNNSPPFDGTTDIQIGSGGTFNVNGGATITGDVVNDGTVKTTNANVTWNGDFVNNNAYISDPSTQNFNNDLEVTANGYIQATKNKDLFRIRGDFKNQSTNTTDWNTVKARLVFAKGGVGNDKDHDFYIVGADNGPTTPNEFAWRLLNVNKQNLTLMDGGGGGALYVKIIKGLLFDGSLVKNIFTDDPINIYYNEIASGFSGTYDFGGTGGGQLIGHTPLPPSVLLMGSGLLGLGLLGWRRRKRG